MTQLNLAAGNVATLHYQTQDIEKMNLHNIYLTVWPAQTIQKEILLPAFLVDGRQCTLKKVTERIEMDTRCGLSIKGKVHSGIENKIMRGRIMELAGKILTHQC